MIKALNKINRILFVLATMLIFSVCLKSCNHNPDNFETLNNKENNTEKQDATVDSKNSTNNIFTDSAKQTDDVDSTPRPGISPLKPYNISTGSLTEKVTPVPTQKRMSINPIATTGKNDDYKDVISGLYSKDRTERVNAIRKLGKIGSWQKDIDILLDIYYKEPLEDGYYIEISAPSVQEEILYSISKLGEEKSRSAILKIIDDCNDVKPKYDAKGSKKYGLITSNIIITSMKLLRKYPERDVENYLKEFALGKRTDNWMLRENAWAGIYDIQMQNANITSMEEKIGFLISNLTDNNVGTNAWVKPGIKSDEAVKNGGIIKLVREMGKPATPYLKEQLKKVSESDKRYKPISDMISNAASLEHPMETEN